GGIMKRGLSCLLVLVAFWSLRTDRCFGQGEDLSVLKRWIGWSDAQNKLQHHLNSLAFRLLDARREKIGALRTAADWKSRQAELKRILLDILGPFPEKTALKPQILEILKKKDYRIEKIVFESRPNFYVTGCLFIPERLRGKAPAILNVIGHTDIAFRAPHYQQLLLNLVRKGFIVFAMDPIGQGERLQYYDSQIRRSRVGRSTREHSYFGKQCFLTGSSSARYFTWDGIRAIDYLVSRPEVDPNRIGVTGLSGGGTQTSYIAAVDERVLAAAPTCYICGFQRLFESIGPQDAEQNFNGGLVHGIDHADFLEVRAPKPTLVAATTRDFFSIQGTRETVAEARKAFRALGAEENLILVEDDFTHGYTRKNREAIYAFFQKHLAQPGDSTDEAVEMLSQEDLRVTPTGQILDSFGGETVYSLNRFESQKLIHQMERSRENLHAHLQKVKEKAGKICGYIQPGPLSGLVFRGRFQRSGYVIEQYVMSGEGQCILPFLFLVPDGAARPPALIYLHPEGKSAAGAPGGELEWWVKQGYAVLSPDLSGTGELGSVDDDAAFLGVQIGRSIVGIRAGDIGRCVQFLKSRSDVNKEKIVAVARGAMTIPLIHAAVFDSSITQLALIDPLVSMGSVVMHRFYSVPFADLVPNALTAYDLPDLEACLAPRRLLILNPQDHLLNRSSPELADKEFGIVRRAYALQQADENLWIRLREPFEPLQELLSDWLAR
ncbi:acetylxylan esterase, partial [Acidobacteria bacterium AH-259-G07]|nr:acetylxylan esterase [Acidobacteria bacterium AH-259-G07]